MAISETSSKARSKGAAARGKRAVKAKVETETKAAGGGGQARAVKCMLTKIEEKMSGNQMKATLGDYIRLVQLHKELDDESPKEIRVTYADFTLSGTVNAGDYVGLSFLTEAYTYELLSGDILANAAQAIMDSVNTFSAVMKATRSGATVRLYYTGGATVAASTAGANGNRFAVYSYSTGAAVWDAGAKTFANGTSPSAWRVTLDFSALQGAITPDLSGTLYTIPTNLIRKMRWTYGADLQPGAFARSEFNVAVSNWNVTGTNRTYSVAGPGSLRIEDHDASMVFSGSWTEVRGNYSGGTIHQTTTPGDSLSCTYQVTQSHALYVGLRYTGTGGTVSIVVDGGAAVSIDLAIPGEDTLFRYSAGTFAAGSHTVAGGSHRGRGHGSLFRFPGTRRAVGRSSGGAESAGCHAGDRLGHAALHFAPAGAHSVDADVSQFRGTGESLCRCIVVL